MALSPGVKQAVSLGAVWLAVAGAAAWTLLHFGESARRAVAAPDQRETRREAPRPAERIVQPQLRAAGRTVEIKAGAHGHYFARAEINGRSIDVLVDSGASIVALSYEDARRAGISLRDSDYTQRVSTANGLARVAPVTLDRVSIGDITVRDVSAAVGEPGSLPTTLLGMSFLSRLQRVDMRAGVLILQE